MNTPTKSRLLERHWLEFLRWASATGAYRGKTIYTTIPREPTEENFWRWYIDTHLTEDTK